MKLSTIVGILLIGMLIGLFINMVKLVVDQPPEIYELIPVSTVLRTSEKTSLIVLFSDPDGPDNINKYGISWESLPGVVQQDQGKPQIAWFSAPVEGDFVVTVTVTDEFGKSDTEAITIFVR